MPAVAGLRLVEGSISESSVVSDAFDRFEPTHVIHSAAAYKDPLDWVENASTNIVGSINVAAAAVRHNVQRLINFQTALCYGRPRTIPIPITHPTAPFTSYGISKTAGEAYMLLVDLPVVSLRLANICAPRLAIGPIPTFYQRLTSGKSCFCSDAVRDFLHVADFLDLVDRALAAGAPTGIFNVSTGEGRSMLEVFNAVATHLGMDPPDVPVLPAGPDDVRQVVLDPAATHAAFGWRATTSFPDTLSHQLRWYDAHGVNDIHSHLQARA